MNRRDIRREAYSTASKLVDLWKGIGEMEQELEDDGWTEKQIAQFKEELDNISQMLYNRGVKTATASEQKGE